MNTRSFYSSVAVFCFALLGGAYYLQHVEKQFPCPFCILQRYAYLAVGIISLIAAVHGPQLRGIARVIYAGLITLFGLTGATLAVWQLLKASKNASCGADAVADFVNTLPPAQWYSEYFFANGGCSDVWPPIFGLSIVVWSIICFCALAIVGAVGFKTALKAAKNK